MTEIREAIFSQLIKRQQLIASQDVNDALQVIIPSLQGISLSHEFKLGGLSDQSSYYYNDY